MTLIRSKPLRARKPMNKVSAKRRAYRQSAEGRAGLAHMARVRALPCLICMEWGFRQTTPTEAHHCIHDRFATRKANDLHTIPLCSEHHRESGDPDKIALHAAPAKWRRLYGADHDWLPKVADMLAGELNR